MPIAKIDLVQKYVGGGKAEPPLSKIGSSTWEKRKNAGGRGGRRPGRRADRHPGRARSQPGIAYPAEDSHWMAEFEAAFPYQETPDQLAAIEAVKRDMAQPRPMDRLICGDVGYGKTEVAIRAAFKAVDAGKQVAVLVPDDDPGRAALPQLLRSGWPSSRSSIEVVNRFRPAAEIKRRPRSGPPPAASTS